MSQSRSSSRSLSKYAVETVPEPIRAARRGDIVQFRYLVSKLDGSDVSDIVDARDPYTGSTPLLCSVMKGQRNMLLYLLQLGADVNAKDANGWNAMHWSVFNAFYELSCHLSVSGCSAEEPDTVGITATALMADHGELYHAFLQKDEYAILQYTKDCLEAEPAPDLALFDMQMEEDDDMGSVSNEDEDDDEVDPEDKEISLEAPTLKSTKNIAINLEKLPTLEEEDQTRLSLPDARIQ